MTLDPRIPCQNMTLRSKNIVSERDTPIPYTTVSKRDNPIQYYRVRTWHSDPRIPCQNVILRSIITVLERDTPIQYYRVGTWHSDPFISLFYFYQVFFMSRRHLNREDLRLKIQQSHHSDHHNYTITTYKHTIKHIEDFTIPPNTYRSLFRVYLSHRNKP